MAQKNEIAVQSQTRYLQNISNPISREFKTDVLKMSAKDLANFVIDSKPPSIWKLFKKDEERTIDTLMLMLIQFQDFYNCKFKMSKEQLSETCFYIVTQLRHFNYYDIGICFKKAKMNTKVYDRIDGGMILELLTLHDIERTANIVNRREQDKSQQNAEWSSLSERSSVQRLKDYLK